MATQKYNRGDVAEGILGATLTAKFINRPKSLKDPNVTVTKEMVNKVLSDFFKKASLISYQVHDLQAQKASTVIDTINFSINLPTASLKFLSNTKDLSEVDDLYDSAISYVEKTWGDAVMEFALNGQIDKINIISDGVGDQKGTKADIKVSINGKPYKRQISLKVAGGEQFAQISGDDFSKQQKLWEEILKLDITKLEKKYNEALENYDKKKLFNSRDDVKLKAFKDMIKNAAGYVYEEAALQIEKKINAKDTNFFVNLSKLVFEGITRGDPSIELVKLEKGSFKQLKFNNDFVRIYSNQLKNGNLQLKVAYSSTGDPIVRIYAGALKKDNLILQIRTKVEAVSKTSKAGKFYSPYMRNYVEAGPLMFKII